MCSVTGTADFVGVLDRCRLPRPDRFDESAGARPDHLHPLRWGQDSTENMFGAGVVFEAIVVLAVKIRSDGTWDVVRLTSPREVWCGRERSRMQAISRGEARQETRGYRG